MLKTSLMFFRRYRRYILSAVLLILTLYVMDAWFLGSLAAFIRSRPAPGSMPDYSLAHWYWQHPLSVAWLYLLKILNIRQLARPDVFTIWVTLNLLIGMFILICGAFAAMYCFSNKMGPAASKVPKMANIATRGTSSWLTMLEAQKIFSFSLVPGILFGKIASLPVVLPGIAGKNMNVAVVGPPGTRKTRAYIIPNMMQTVKMNWSTIVTDPKGELTRKMRRFFEKNGYVTRVFNLVNLLNSDRWNPLSVVQDDLDAQLFCQVIIDNTAVPGRKGGDPFWDRAELNLLKALVLLVINEYPKEERNMGTLYSILAGSDSRSLNDIFGHLPPDHPARMPFNIYSECDPKVRAGVIIGLGTRLECFQNSYVRALTASSDIDLELPGKRPCAYFCIISDMDSTYSFLASLFFSFLFIKLTRLADDNIDLLLPVPVNFELDEFCNIGHIPDFSKKISTMRSRGIACSIVIQSLVQLMSRYPEKEWETILSCCDYWLIMGVQDNTTAQYFSTSLGEGTIIEESYTRHRGIDHFMDLGQVRTAPQKRKLMNADELRRLNRDESVLMISGWKPMRLKKIDYTEHPMSEMIEEADVRSYKPDWVRDLLEEDGEEATFSIGERLAGANGKDNPPAAPQESNKEEPSATTEQDAAAALTEKNFF